MADVNFADLFPERLTITGLPDGSSLTLINRDEMGVEDFAEFIGLQSRFEDLAAKAEAAKNETAAMNMAKKMDAALDDVLVRLSANGTRPEDLAEIRMGQKAAILTRWKAHQGDLTPKNG